MAHLGEHVQRGLVSDAMLLGVTGSDRLAPTLFKLKCMAVMPLVYTYIWHTLVSMLKAAWSRMRCSLALAIETAPIITVV